MNFFESQAAAKRSTARLVVLFALAVLSLVLVTNLLAALAFGAADPRPGGPAVDWPRVAVVSGAVLTVVLAGSLYRIGTLSGGGARVAEMMGGRLLLAGSGNPRERRTLNVVEEMAIASGTPVPPVYLIEEDGINAFAAGYSPSDAVIGLTRGAVETLDREQLQGVVAHEFSHILHGDMRINIRLMGVLFGITALGAVGYHLLRGAAFSRRSKGAGGIMLLGLGVLAAGYAGVFFGNLIKAAVSRQREYLADASAVQFTRNPNGIAGALMRIARHERGSRIDHPAGAEISHSLFGEGARSALRGLYATHPPLDDRIRAILPHWDGGYDLIARRGTPPPAPEAGGAPRPSRTAAAGAALAAAALAEGMIERTGRPEGADIARAAAAREALPAALLDAAREPSGARAVVYLQALARTDPVRRRQLNLLEHSADAGVRRELERLLRRAEPAGPAQRLALIEIAIASLRQLSPRQYSLFRSNFNEMIALDGKVSLPEWTLQKIVFHHLDAVFGLRRASAAGGKGLAGRRESAAVLLSVLARAGGRDPETALAAAAERLGMPLALLPAQEINYERLDRALAELGRLDPRRKPALLRACAACVAADGEVRPIEAELVRAIAAVLDCPMPPPA